MKNVHYIGLLISGIIFSSSAYAQTARLAQNLDDIFAPSKTQEVLSTKEAQDNAQQKIKELYEGDKIIIKSIVADYSFPKGAASISTKPIKNGIASNISTTISENNRVKTEELFKSLANAMDRGTAYCEEILASKLVVVALSQSVNTLAQKGLLSEVTEGSLNIVLALTKDSANSYNVDAKITSDKGDVTVKLTAEKCADGVYTIVGNVADTSLTLKVVKNGDTYTFAGGSDETEVKTTISDKIDLSLTLTSSSLTEENGNGTVLKTRSAQNINGKHCVSETLLNGDTFSSSYKGTTLIPYEEYKVLSAEFNK